MECCQAIFIGNISYMEFGATAGGREASMGALPVRCSQTWQGSLIACNGISVLGDVVELRCPLRFLIMLCRFLQGTTCNVQIQYIVFLGFGDPQCHRWLC